MSKGSQSSRHKRILASLIVTLIVVTILLFPAPVRAITITVEGLKGQEITQGETFTFTINMKIESGERVPINKIRITVEGPTSFTYLFSPMGGEQYFLRLETPQSIIDGTAYGYGYGYGYGRFYGYGYGYFPATPPYGYGYGYYPTGYGYGYGYGYGFYGPQTLRWTAVLIHTENLPIGEYKLRVEIQSDGAWWGGIPTEVTFTITAPPVNVPPVADAGPDQWVYVNHTISFDGSASYDPDGFIVSYEWNFGDGKTGVGMIVEHNYTQSGVYVVTLTVRDNDGATDTDVAAVTVESLPLPPEKEVVVVVPEGQTGYVVDASEEANVTITLNSTASTTVTVVKYPDNPHPEAPPPVDNIPKYVDFVISNPEAVTWPIYVEISYTDAEVAGLDESSLGMYYWNEAEGGWRRCSNTGVDTVRNVVWAWMTKEEAVGVKITVGGLALPDLKPTSIEIIPSEPVAGEEVEVDVTIENIGTADAGQFDVTFEVDNVAIQTLSVEGLAVNGTVTLTFTWTPSEPGVYSLTAIVDAEGVVDELNEDNNILTETVKVGPLVDLTVQFINLPERFIAGEEHSVQVLVKNIGEAAADSFNVELKANGVSLGKIEVQGLAAGASRTVTFTWKPEEAGSYTLTATVDPENQIAETDETNNAVSVTVTVGPKPLPDLTVEFASLPEKLDAGTTYEIDVLVKNIGEAVAEGFNVELVADGVSIGKTRIESLAAGASRTVTFTWKPEEAGSYTLTATVDPENQIAETDETNNSATITLTVAAIPVPWYVQWWPAIAAVVILIVVIVVIVALRKKR